MCIQAHVWRSEDFFWESVFSFHHGFLGSNSGHLNWIVQKSSDSLSPYLSTSLGSFKADSVQLGKLPWVEDLAQWQSICLGSWRPWAESSALRVGCYQGLSFQNTIHAVNDVSRQDDNDYDGIILRRNLLSTDSWDNMQTVIQPRQLHVCIYFLKSDFICFNLVY